jgi:hypothetical protein
MPKPSVFRKGVKIMEIGIKAFGSMAIVGGIVLAILLYYHKQTPAVWTTFTTIVFISLAFCLYWQKTIWDAQDEDQNKSIKTNALKFPDKKFSRMPDKIRISFGGTTVSYSADKIIDKKVIPFKGMGVDLTAYIEDKILYIDTNIYSGKNKPIIKISKNKMSLLPHKWDYNSTNKALEVVNENKIPVYQLIYLEPNHISISGIFVSGNNILIADKNGLHLNPKLPFSYLTERIFKYPSWKYPSEYKDQNR